MPNTLNIALLQSPGSLSGPQSRIDWLAQSIDATANQQIDLLVLPELFLSGYNIGDNVQQWSQKRDSVLSRQIAEIAVLNNMAILFGYAERDGSQLFNSAACYNNAGSMISHQRKLLLPPGFESNHFTRGNSYSTHFQVGEFKIATLICYDAEFPEAFRAVSGADLVIVPTALGAQWEVVSERLIPTRAFENGVYVCYANHCGEENGLAYYGGSCIVGPDGRDIARASKSDICLLANLELPAVREAQSRLPYLIDRFGLPEKNSAENT